MLQARDVTYTINGRSLISRINLEVPSGCIAVLIGPNGAGKSTLLRVLAGELKPSSGSVCLNSRDISSFSAGELASRRAVVSQSSPLTFPFTVLEVAMLGITVPGFNVAPLQIRIAALDCLDAVGMRELADRLYVHLSGGEKQRVHFARTLCQLSTGLVAEPATRCLLLDEPTASLDLAHQAMVLAAIRKQASKGIAVVAVFHDLNLAAALADQLVLMERGRITAAGSARAVLKDDLLSKAFGCPVLTNRTPSEGKPFVLPPACLQLD